MKGFVVLNNKSLYITLITIAVIVMANLWINKKIDTINEQISIAEFDRLKSIELVDELRQSSDDLTRLGRLYVVTGDSTYFNYFQKVISIRDGDSPRPVDYNQVYWDYILVDGKAPRPDGESISLMNLIQIYCQEEDIIEHFKNAKESSDDLIQVELEAFNALAGLFKDSNGAFTINGEPDRNMAIDLLYGDSYLRAKAKIMKAIDDFYYFISTSTQERINELQYQQKLYSDSLNGALIILIGIIALFILYVLSLALRRESPQSDNHNSEKIFGKIITEIQNSWGLIILGIVFSLLVIVFFNVSKNTVEKNIRNDIKESLTTVLETTTNNITNWLLDSENNLSKFSESNVIQELFSTPFDQWLTTDHEKFQQEINTRFLDESFRHFILTDTDGNIIFTSNALWNEKNVIDLDNSLNSESLIEPGTPFNRFPSTKGTDLEYNHNIKFGIPINQTYLLIVLLDPQERFTKVLQGGRLGESGESYALNPLGEMISESRFTRQLQEMGLLDTDQLSELNIEIRDPLSKLSEDDVSQYGLTEMAKNVLSGYSGINIEGYNDYRGVKVIGTWAWLENYSIGITTEIDYSEAYQTVFLFEKLSLYAIMFFIFLILLLIIIFIVNRYKMSSLNREISYQSALMKSLINAIPDLVFFKDTELKFLGVNRAFEKMVGKKREDIIGESDETIIPEQLAAEFKKIDLKILENEQPVSIENEDIDQSGNTIIFDTKKRPFYTEDGQLLGLIGISRDITERKRQEEIVKASENKFRSITSTATDAIVSADNNGLIESWNLAAETIFGYTSKEAIGQPLEIIIPSKYHSAHKEGMSRIASGGERHAIGKTVELLGQHKDGHTFPIDLSLSTWMEGSISKFSGIIRDITERKLYEKAIEAANKRMSTELNVAKDIQMSMLPLIFPAFPQRKEIDIYGSLIPAREVGGDFYDFHFLDDNHIYFVVGDVSGKGVPAALMMAVTKTLLKSTAGTDRSTASILTHVNNEIAKDNDAYMFITIFIAILNTTTGEMVYSNAGHNPSFIIKNDREVVKLGDLHGPVIGAMEDMTYTETIVNINKDDIIFAYTDGVTEAHNSKEELYSDPRLINILKNGEYNDPKSLTKLIEDSVFEFQGKAEQFDDITLLSLKYLDDKQTDMTNSISVTIKNQLKQMPEVLEAFEAFGEKNELSFGVIQKFNIALDELLNNIISYGFKDELEHEIVVDIELRNERLIITLSDDGIPFNPFRNDPPDTKLTIDERNIGGLGIHIVKNLVDEYDYKRNTDKNIITLVKYNINK